MKAALMLLKPKGGEGKDLDAEEEDAARDILDAIKDDDAKALSMALGRYYELCEQKHHEEEGDEEEDEGPESTRY